MKILNFPFKENNKSRHVALIGCQKSGHRFECCLGFEFTAVLLLFVFLVLFTSGDAVTRNGSGICSWEALTFSLFCSNFITTNGTKGPGDEFMQPTIKILRKQVISQVRGIRIEGSFIPALNLKQFDAFEALEKLTVSNSGVISVWGNIPKSLRSLNLSSNALMTDNFGNEVFAKQPHLVMLDLSNNKLDQIPYPVLELKNLEELYLMDNELKCHWLTSTDFYNWASENQGVIQDIDDTFCKPENSVFRGMTILSAYKIRQTALEECDKLSCQCDIYTTTVVEHDSEATVVNIRPIHSNKYEKVYVTLGLDCSSMNLTELPSISPYVVALNISNNRIRDLSRLNNDVNYANLTSITVNHNLVENLEEITSTKFFDRVQFFEIRDNSISSMTDTTIRNIFTRSNNTRRILKILIGDNTIRCDCDSFQKLKPSLVTHESIVKDWKTIRCRTPDVTLHDLKYEQACRIETTEMIHWPWWMILLIVLECFLIVFVLIKLFYDRRQYRRTRQLPRLSSCIPSLPCDFMLERIEDSKSHHHHHQNHWGHKR